MNSPGKRNLEEHTTQTVSALPPISRASSSSSQADAEEEVLVVAGKRL